MAPRPRRPGPQERAQGREPGWEATAIRRAVTPRLYDPRWAAGQLAELKAWAAAQQAARAAYRAEMGLPP